MKYFFKSLILAVLLVAASCNKDGVIEQMPYPTITITEGYHLTVRAGEQFTIEPEYEFVDEQSVYSWTIGLLSLSSNPTLMHSFERVGSYIITLYVTNETGTNYVDIRVDVVERDKPMVELAGAAEGFRIAEGEVLHLLPAVRQTPVEYSYRWSVDGVEVATSLAFDFEGYAIGNYQLRFEVLSDYGTAVIDFAVEVVSPSDMPFEWYFDAEEYSAVIDRTLLIEAYDISMAVERYEWRVNGELQATTDLPRFGFKSSVQGGFTVEATAFYMAGDKQQQTTERLKVNVYANEITHYRQASASSSRHWNRVYSYMPAPGQFINDTQSGFDGSESSVAAAIAYAERRLQRGQSATSGSYLSLGSFGGSVVVGFDHSILSSNGDYDFAIRGNAFKESSEPGIVYVMQDENGDGEPNDTWYELAGSHRMTEDCMTGYAVTYFRPMADGMSIQWRDNRGNVGEVDYNAKHHSQPNIFPAWVEGESYTLRGTYLRSRAYAEAGKWIMAGYDWGYADNHSAVDMASGQSGVAAENRFRISDAVYSDGTPIKLHHIDFVKVQTACLAQCGELGELSTEVCAIYELNK